MSKIVKALEHAVEAAKCAHDFEYLHATKFARGGEVARCRRCRCRFTAWPGSVHYEAVVAARDLQSGGA